VAADLVYLWWDTVYSIIQHVRSVSGYVPQVEKSCSNLGNIFRSQLKLQNEILHLFVVWSNFHHRLYDMQEEKVFLQLWKSVGD